MHAFSGCGDTTTEAERGRPASRVSAAGAAPHPRRAVTSFVFASKKRQKASPPMPVVNAKDHLGVAVARLGAQACSTLKYNRERSHRSSRAR